MSAREEILGRVRSALVGAPEPPAVDRSYRLGRNASVDLVALLVERVEDYRAEVRRCSPAEVEAAIRDALPAGARVVVPTGLPWVVDSAVEDDGLSHAELDALDGVVTGATVAIAETGTIVLTHGPGEGRRALTLVPDVHVCVVLASQVVADVPDAVAVLDPARPMTWVSGPSATSDIELDRVEGVHGPRRLHVIVVDDAAG